MKQNIIMIMSYLFLAILLTHLGQVSSGTITVIDGKDRIEGVVEKSVTMKWRAICDVGEFISQYSIYLPGNQYHEDADGIIRKQKYSNNTNGILKDRLQLLYFPVNESNYQLGGDFHLTLKGLKLDETYNFTLKVLFSEWMADSRLTSINVLSWIAIQRVTGGPFGCDGETIKASGKVQKRVIVEENTAASVIFTRPICVRGYPKPYLMYKLSGSEFVFANSDIQRLRDNNQYQISKFTTTKLSSSDCGKQLQFHFIGYQSSLDYGGPEIKIKFIKPVIHSMHKQPTADGKTTFTWQVKNTGQCEISGYTVTATKSDGSEVEYSINSLKKSFTLPSEDITKFRIKSLFIDSKANDESNHWYDVDNPVDPVTPEESSSNKNLLIGVAVAVSLIIVIVLILIFCLIKRRNKSDNTSDINASENQRLQPAQPNEYVQMPVKSKPEKQDNIVYDVVGIGGGRVPGSTPAQPTNRTPQQSHYSEVKTDEMGYPVTR